MASWSKVKKQLEENMAPSVEKYVAYKNSSYRYTKDKSGTCYIAVNDEDVFAWSLAKIIWFQNEQEVLRSKLIKVVVLSSEIEEYKKLNDTSKIPEDRIATIVEKRKEIEIAKKVFDTQQKLCKSDFQQSASIYLTTSVDVAIKESNILMNVFALLDRRVGKSRLRKLKVEMEQRHPAVQYVYQFRCSCEGI